MSTVDNSAFSSIFAHWEPEVQALIAVSLNLSYPILHIYINILVCHQCVEKPMQWAIHTVRPMQSFVSGRVALLGDAVSS